jgi:hypothetical protein
VRVGHARANLACFHDRPEDSHTCERHAVEADSCGELERLRVVEAERDGAPGEPCELPLAALVPPGWGLRGDAVLASALVLDAGSCVRYEHGEVDEPVYEGLWELVWDASAGLDDEFAG